LSTNMRELRFNFCIKGSSSQGTRTFLTQHYDDLKQLNPKLSIAIREGEDIEPLMIARYDWGQYKMVKLSSLEEPQILQKLKELVEIGETMPRSGESAPPDDDIIYAFKPPTNRNIWPEYFY